MNILILTLGSHGDVQPYVALGRGLQEAGHHVRLATAEPFASFVRDRGLEFAPLTGKFLDLMETSAGKKAFGGKSSALKLLREAKPIMRQMLDDGWRAADGIEAVIYHPKALGGYSIAEKLNIPAILSVPLPLYSPTSAFPSPILPVGNLGGPLNRASHRLAVWLAAASMRGTLNGWRREVLGLAPVRNELELHGRPVLRLYPYSPAVIPTPADWDASSLATGYWFLEHAPDWAPDPGLLRFLDGGPPPVYVGFGSMPSEDAAAKTGIVLAALAETGLRGVLATGWGGLASTQVPDNVFVLDAAPHDWLFPRMAAVVHHGGAGTTGAGLRAGVPSVICPFFGDQPFWGRRVAALGVGPEPIGQKRLTAERLAAALRTVTGDAGMRERAAALGSKIRAEDGIGRAIAAIEGYASHQPVPANERIADATGVA